MGALAQVQQWLDHGPGSRWAQRDARVAHGVAGAWRVDLQDDSLPVKAVRIVLPGNFPASPCELFVDRSYFLKVPHVEADGHVCLGHASIPSDYEDPIGAILHALKIFKDELLVPAQDAGWVEQQFQAERSSYWAQMCLRRKFESTRRPAPAQTYVDLDGLDGWSRGALAGYLKKGIPSRRYTRQIAVLGEVDPHAIATRHGWAMGTMVRGNALFVRLPKNTPWTPGTWPTTFSSLDALIAGITGGDISLSAWLKDMGWNDVVAPAPPPSPKKHQRRNPERVPLGQRPLLVVLADEGATYGFQVFAPLLPGVTAPNIEPIQVTRVDPDWALARDHRLDIIRLRRAKRVLLLGCGSLGSPLVKALARAGVGQLDLLDAQTMEAENTSRHELGLDDIGLEKAPTLARRITKETPGVRVRGFTGKVEVWCTKNCQPGDYDLVIECTGESSVRSYLSKERARLFGRCPLIHAWTEPLCSAAHVVLTQADEPWPMDDPADTLVNASDLSAAETRVVVPACAGGFHPYGAADIELVAAFAAERVIGVIDNLPNASMVWSWVRAMGFFDQLPVTVTPRAIVPVSESKWDSATVTRTLTKVLQGV